MQLLLSFLLLSIAHVCLGQSTFALKVSSTDDSLNGKYLAPLYQDEHMSYGYFVDTPGALFYLDNGDMKMVSADGARVRIDVDGDLASLVQISSFVERGGDFSLGDNNNLELDGVDYFFMACNNTELVTPRQYPEWILAYYTPYINHDWCVASTHVYAEFMGAGP
uniref:ARAD1D04752p n=1 Tax=Blastobotrys adeninivorans TaxID=409370 RepID=A0A060T878_BLAAD